MTEIKKSQAVALQSITLPATAGMKLPAFIEFVLKHNLAQPEVTLLVEMTVTHKLSVSYVGGLLRNGIKLPYIHAAYVLRDEIPPLYDSNTSRGGRKSEFPLPIEKICELMSRIYREDEVDEEESIEAAIRLLSEVADRCPQFDTWSSVLDVLIEALGPLLVAIERREGDMLDIPPPEKVEAMIRILDEQQLIADGRC